MLDAGLYKLLTDNAATLGAKFYPGELPQNAVLPAGTYMAVGGSSEPTFDTAGAQHPRYQFDCYATVAMDAMTLKASLVTLLNRYRGTLSDSTVLQYAELIDYAGPLFDPDRRMFYCRADFYLHHNFTS